MTKQSHAICKKSKAEEALSEESIDLLPLEQTDSAAYLLEAIGRKTFATEWARQMGKEAPLIKGSA